MRNKIYKKEYKILNFQHPIWSKDDNEKDIDFICNKVGSLNKEVILYTDQLRPNKLMTNVIFKRSRGNNGPI